MRSQAAARSPRERSRIAVKAPLTKFPIQDTIQMNTDPTAPEVERYVCLEPYDHLGAPNMEPGYGGEWVRYEDYEKLKEELGKYHAWIEFAKGLKDLKSKP